MSTSNIISEPSRRCNGKHGDAVAPPHSRRITSGEWKVCASDGAMNTSNPIREIIETMNLAENPNKKVIPLSIGDPTIFGNLKPCKEILDALQRANACGKYYGYQVAAGMESARESVAEYHFRCTGNRVKVQDVVLASGCSHAIDLSICVLAKQGQNILIPRPGFPLYKTLTSIYGVHYKQYNLEADKNWQVDLKHLESLIDEQTAAIVINNPSNPCGSVFSKRHLLDILELAERHRLPIIADEIYDKFVFAKEFYRKRRSSSIKIGNGQLGARSSCALVDEENRQPAVSVDNSNSIQLKSGSSSNNNNNNNNNNSSSKPNERDDLEQPEPHFVPFIAMSKLSETVPILTCGGISKTCLIPGLRLGWIIINDKKNIFDSSIRSGLNRLTQRLMGPNSLVQGALSDILASVPEGFYSQTMDFIFHNAKLCYDRLLRVHGLQPYMPQGSMYLMVKFDAKLFPNVNGDLDFTSKLMNEESVLVLPGKCFDFPDFFRLCLTVPTNVMEEALSRIEQFCKRHSICSNETKQQQQQDLHATNGKVVNSVVSNKIQQAKSASMIKQQYHQNHQQTEETKFIILSATSESQQQQQAATTR